MIEWIAANDLHARWAFVKPWCSPVRGRLAFRYEFSKRENTRSRVGVELLRCPDENEHVGVRDALVLLAMIANVDRHALVFVLKVHCSVDMSDVGDDMDNNDLALGRVLLAVSTSDCDGGGWSPAALAAFLFKTSTRASVEFDATARKVARQGVLNRPLLTRVDIPVAITVKSGWADVYRALRPLHSANWRFPIATTQHCRGSPAPTSAFVLDPVVIDIARNELTTDTAALIADMMLRDDAPPLEKLTLRPQMRRDLAVDALSNWQAMGSMLGRLLCATGRLGKIDELEFCCSLSRPRAFVRMCSAIAQTRTTKSITLDFVDAHGMLADGVRARMWKVITYALLSHGSGRRSSVTSVILRSIYLTREDADVVAAALESEDPIADVFDRDLGSLNPFGSQLHDKPAVRVALKQGTTIHIVNPGTRLSADLAVWKLPSDVYGTMSLAVDGPDAWVLLPGYGVCAVAKDAVELVGDDEGERQQFHGDLTTLKLDFINTPAAVQGLARFLELVGSTLTKLELRMVHDSGLDICHLLGLCPVLEALVVHGPCINTAEFLKRYRENSVLIVELECRFDDIGAFMKELTDPRTQLAQKLKRFIYSFRAGEHYLSTEPFTTADMASNNVLEYLQVSSCQRTCTRLLSGLRRFHFLPIAVAREPFPLANRVALISVFASMRHRREQGLGPDVSLDKDRLTLQLIFAYAAECVRRRVVIRVLEPDECPARCWCAKRGKTRKVVKRG
jgi:hypothetical protein